MAEKVAKSVGEETVKNSDIVNKKPKSKKSAGMHDEHRQRKKEQFRRWGIEQLADHEVLELLLYYAIPRQDTNPIAHRLLDRFGTLDALFAAPLSEIMKVEGVGENAATLIKLIFPICRRVRISGKYSEIILNSHTKSGEFFRDYFYGEKNEVFYEACLDSKGKLVACYRLAEGVVDTVAVSPRKIVENALASNASKVILAHNHPSGVATPSKGDIYSTKTIKRALEAIDIALDDHIIVADEEYISMCVSGAM